MHLYIANAVDDLVFVNVSVPKHVHLRPDPPDLFVQPLVAYHQRQRLVEQEDPLGKQLLTPTHTVQPQ